MLPGANEHCFCLQMSVSFSLKLISLTISCLAFLWNSGSNKPRTTPCLATTNQPPQVSYPSFSPPTNPNFSQNPEFPDPLVGLAVGMLVS